MKVFTLRFFRLLTSISIGILINYLPLTAQTHPDICADQDCPSEVLSIPLDAAVDPGGNTSQRTAQFEAAYLKFKQLKANTQKTPGWTAKYDAFQLGGKSCLRMYQLASYFANEYEQNADFKQFIDDQETGPNPLRESGFAASRRALNLQDRMKNKCPEEIKQVEQQAGTSLGDMPQKYMKLGQLLGYFDEAGNLKKPLQDPTPVTPAATGNKKAQIANLQNLLNGLPIGQKAQDQLNGIKNGLNAAQPQLGNSANLLFGLKPQLNALLGKPASLLSKLGPTNQLLNKLKGFVPKIPNTGLVGKIAGLFTKGKALVKQAQEADNLFKQLKQRLGKCTEESNQTGSSLTQQISQVGKLNQVRTKLQAEKTSLLNQLAEKPKKYLDELTQSAQHLKQQADAFNQQVATAGQLKAQLLAQIGIEAKCADELSKDIGTAKKDLETLETAQQTLATATQQAATEVEQAKQAEAAQAVQAAQADQLKAQEAALKREQEALRSEFGIEMTLEPVAVTEWTEGFEVKRSYWEAVFHPDDEVVAGHPGRYFQVRLKDAEKNVKLLFGPGEYFMKKSSFRDTYGPTVGAFVIEALHAMKKADQGKVKLFVQGSADIAGDASFRGTLDSRYEYREVKVLPLDRKSDRFLDTPVRKAIPEQSFRNTDLPDLRGNYLREMISVYSKKLKPVLLEGAVQAAVNEEDRNAVIYLYIPAEIVAAYEEE